MTCHPAVFPSRAAVLSPPFRTALWLALAALSLPLGAVGEARADTVRYYDSTLNSGWTHSHSTSGQTATTTRLTGYTSYGQGVFLTEVQKYSFQSSCTYRAEHWWTGATFVPAARGTVTWINWSIAFETYQAGHTWQLLARQGGSVFMFPPSEGSWQEGSGFRFHTRGFNPTQVTRLSGSGTLNLTDSSVPVQFGYVNFNANGLATGYFFSGIFDLTLTYTAPCNAADIGQSGGFGGPDHQLNNNDFIVFIDRFFESHPIADRGRAGGVAGTDGQFDNNDFIVFIDQFFAGC